MGDAFGTLINTMVWLCIVFVPLGIWKAVEIVWWVITHISISFGGAA